MRTPEVPARDDTQIEARRLTVDDLPALEALVRECYSGALSDSEEWARVNGLIKKPVDGIPPLIASRAAEVVAYAGVYAEPWMFGAKRRRVHLLAGEAGAGRHLIETLLEKLRGCDVTSVEVRIPGEDPLARSLLVNMGFSELRQDVVMEFDVIEASPAVPSVLPPEVRLVRLESELDLDPLAMSRLHALWITLAKEDPAHDPAGDPPLEAFDKWMRSPASFLQGCFLAAVGGRYVGVTLSRRTADKPDTLFQNLTGVLTDYRRLGVATALKQAACESARDNGFQLLKTSVAGSNEAIRSLNTRLGYRNRLILTVFEKSLGE